MPFYGSRSPGSPVLLNKDGTPYTDVDARRYFENLGSNAFANPAHRKQFEADKEMLKRDFGQRAVPEGGRQKSLSTVLRQNIALKDTMNRSEKEHTREGGTQDSLHELGRYVAFRTGATFVPGPLKSWGRLLGKVMDYSVKYDKNDKASRLMGHAMDYSHLGPNHPKNKALDRGYAGDFGKAKDAVRLTLVGEDQTQYGLARAVTRAIVTTPSNGMAFLKDVTRDPEQDPCGYSDTNMVVVLPNGQPGEMQVNNKAILYGKMSKSDFCTQLGVSPAAYFMLRMHYGVEGGLGHALYEIYQADKGKRGEDAAELATDYYGTLRTFPKVNVQGRKTLVNELAKFKKAKENAHFFAHV